MLCAIVALINRIGAAAIRRYSRWLIQISEVNLADAGLYPRVEPVERLPRREVRIGKHSGRNHDRFGFSWQTLTGITYDLWQTLVTTVPSLDA